MDQKFFWPPTVRSRSGFLPRCLEIRMMIWAFHSRWRVQIVKKFWKIKSIEPLFLEIVIFFEFLKKLIKFKILKKNEFFDFLKNFFSKLLKKRKKAKTNFRERPRRLSVWSRFVRCAWGQKPHHGKISGVGPAEHRPCLGSGSAGRPVKRRSISGRRSCFNSRMRLAKGFFLPFLAAEMRCSAVPSGVGRASGGRPAEVL